MEFRLTGFLAGTLPVLLVILTSNGLYVKIGLWLSSLTGGKEILEAIRETLVVPVAQGLITPLNMHSMPHKLNIISQNPVGGLHMEGIQCLCGLNLEISNPKGIPEFLDKLHPASGPSFMHTIILLEFNCHVKPLESRLSQEGHSKIDLRCIGLEVCGVGVETTVMQVEEVLRALPMCYLFQLVGPIRPVNNSLSSNTKTIYLEVWDSKAGSAVKELIGRTVQFSKYACHIVKGKAVPRTPLCQRCWHWGHPFKICRAQAVCCPLCSEEHHCSMGSCCKEKPKATTPIATTPASNPCPHPVRCTACGGAHPAYAKTCPFWKHCFQREWIDECYWKVSTARRAHTKSQNSLAHVFFF
jgi:hypothetical protein